MQEENCRNFNKKRKKAYQYEIGDIVAIQRTQFGTGLKLRPKFFGPYEVVKVKPKDRYDSLSVPSFLYVSDSPLVSMKKKKNKYRCGQRTVRLAIVESSATGISSKARSLRAQAQLIKTKTETLTIEREQRNTEVREQALPSTHHGNPIVE
ncbi:transposon Tf2-9 polyprotein [Trichonephila clavipes]|nr:transposon Tf2-9 polyprotein [Trichonephila clavipes]